MRLKPFRFSPLYRYLYDFFNYTEREKFLYQVMDYVRSNRIEGDYLEFGLLEGGTFIPAHHFAKSMGRNLINMNFIG